jgi:hypothetical protein
MLSREDVERHAGPPEIERPSYDIKSAWSLSQRGTATVGNIGCLDR